MLLLLSLLWHSEIKSTVHFIQIKFSVVFLSRERHPHICRWHDVAVVLCIEQCHADPLQWLDLSSSPLTPPLFFFNCWMISQHLCDNAAEGTPTPSLSAPPPIALVGTSLDFGRPFYDFTGFILKAQRPNFISIYSTARIMAIFHSQQVIDWKDGGKKHAILPLVHCFVFLRSSHCSLCSLCCFWSSAGQYF